MAGQPYVWQISSPNLNTGVGVISSAYNVDGKSPFTTITTDNPTGYVKVFPNSNSNDLNIKNLEYAIQTDGKITYRVQDGTQNPKQYNSLQELADNRGNWTETTTKQIQSQIKGILQSFVSEYNQTNPDSPIGPATANQEQTQNQTLIGTEEYQLEQIEADKDNKKTAWRGKIYRYPTKIGDNRQDFIKFEVYDYKTRRPSRENPLVQEKDRNLGSQIATIVLPIQPTIVDNNTVDWNGLGLNPVELAGYGLSTAGMTGGSNGNDFGEILGKLGTTITEDPDVRKALLLYLKQKAIGVNGLLSRFGGAIVNPNIELLFQGTQLRPFNFSFRLSPRDRDEAKQVKSIIRVFKEAMSAKTASGGIFLAAPNVFKIRYINGITNDDHTSLNQIKTCALQSCSVDYTPDGSYMTFKDTDSGNPMTSYNLNLQFQELEPVIDTDYKEFTDESTIGY
jgi:hypothetical protein